MRGSNSKRVHRRAAATLRHPLSSLGELVRAGRLLLGRHDFLLLEALAALQYALSLAGNGAALTKEQHELCSARYEQVVQEIDGAHGGLPQQR